MVLHKSAVWCLLLAASAVYCHPEDDDSDDKFQCHGDGGRLDRGGQQLIFSPNANVSCDSVVFSPVGNDSAASALSSLPKGSIPIVGGNVRCSEWPMQYISLPSNITEDRVRITWNCPGDVVYCRIVNIVDPASTTTTIPSIVVSQTCSLTSKSPLGTGGSTALTDISLTGSVPVGGTTAATAATTGGVAPTEIMTTGPGAGPTMGLVPSGSVTTQGQGPYPTTTFPGGPEGTDKSPVGEGTGTTTSTRQTTPQDTDAVGLSTTAPTAPGNGPAPTSMVGTQGNGDTTSPMGMGTSTGTGGQGVPSCTCNHG